MSKINAECKKEVQNAFERNFDRVLFSATTKPADTDLSIIEIGLRFLLKI